MVTTVQNTESPKSSSTKKTRAPQRKISSRTAASRKSRRKSPESMTANLYRQGRDAVSGAYESATKAGRSLPRLTHNLDLRSRGQSAYSMMEERPFVLGAVGLGLGMALAALLPSITDRRKSR
jgi:hypothetical protein